MGEAVFYLKARFESEGAAQKALPRVCAFLERTRACEEEFQAHRPDDNDEARAAWTALRARYGDVFCGLGITPPDDDEYHGLNCLSSELSAPPEDTEPYQTGNEVRFCGMVWHFASWAGFERYMRSIGALAVGYVSDEYADLYDCIDLSLEGETNGK